MTDELLLEIDAFMTRRGIADSTFGILAVGDGHLVKRIRDGKRIRRSTVLKIRRYMALAEIESA